MHELNHVQINGVRCYWVDTGRPTLSAQLAFRGGAAYESILESGWFHLIEHLTLEGLDKPLLQINGFTDLLSTRFAAHGPAAGVAEFINQVCARLAEPNLENLAHHARILAAESSQRTPWLGNPALVQHFGSVGPGVAIYDEPGLINASVTELHRRIATHFVRDNAVLMLDGPPPPELRCELPAGPEVTIPAAVRLDDVQGAYANPHFLISGVVRRTMAATFLGEIMHRELKQSLRETHSVSYAPWAHYEAVDAELALVVGGADLNQQLEFSKIQEIAQRISESPVSEDVLAEFKAERLQAMADPYSAIGVASSAAHSWLTGKESYSWAELQANYANVTVEDLAEVQKQLHLSQLFGVPDKVTWDVEYPVIEFPTIEGGRATQEFRSVNAESKWRLGVGAQQLQVRSGQKLMRIKYTDAVAYFKFGDGGRRLIARDGWTLSVDPWTWLRSQRAIRELDARVPSTLHLELPNRAESEPPKPASFGAWLWSFAKAKKVPLAVLGVLAVLVGSVRFLASSGQISQPPGLLLVAASGLTVGVLLNLRQDK